MARGMARGRPLCVCSQRRLLLALPLTLSLLLVLGMVNFNKSRTLGVGGNQRSPPPLLLSHGRGYSEEAMGGKFDRVLSIEMPPLQTVDSACLALPGGYCNCTWASSATATALGPCVPRIDDKSVCWRRCCCQAVSGAAAQKAATQKAATKAVMQHLEVAKQARLAEAEAEMRAQMALAMAKKDAALQAGQKKAVKKAVARLAEVEAKKRAWIARAMAKKDAALQAGQKKAQKKAIMQLMEAHLAKAKADMRAQFARTVAKKDAAIAALQAGAGQGGRADGDIASPATLHDLLRFRPVSGDGNSPDGQEGSFAERCVDTDPQGRALQVGLSRLLASANVSVVYIINCEAQIYNVEHLLPLMCALPGRIVLNNYWKDMPASDRKRLYAVVRRLGLNPDRDLIDVDDRELEKMAKDGNHLMFAAVTNAASWWSVGLGRDDAWRTPVYANSFVLTHGIDEDLFWGGHEYKNHPLFPSLLFTRSAARLRAQKMAAPFARATISKAAADHGLQEREHDERGGGGGGGRGGEKKGRKNILLTCTGHCGMDIEGDAALAEQIASLATEFNVIHSVRHQRSCCVLGRERRGRGVGCYCCCFCCAAFVDFVRCATREAVLCWGEQAGSKPPHTPSLLLLPGVC